MSLEFENGLPAPRIDHLTRLSDEIGIFEHATGLVPAPEHGYTTEDAARALVVTVRWWPQTELTAQLTRTYLAFIEASIVEGGAVRNRMTADRRWVGPISADAHGRAIWGLCTAAAEARSRPAGQAALACLERIEVFDDPSLRPWVYTGLGAARLLAADSTHRQARSMTRAVLSTLPKPGRSGWIWPETRLAYDNARVAQCLLEVGRALELSETVSEGLRLLTWLVSIERLGDHFSFTPVGGRGPGDRSPAFDQQPLEATAMVDACATAWEITADPSWFDLARQAAQWFVGRNDRGTTVYDSDTGAGHDGLTETGVNENAGAESTISALWAMQSARRLERHRSAAPPLGVT